jgi:hypothetical protein
MSKQRKSAKSERFREMYRDRLKRIKHGQQAPETVKEWAIWHKGFTVRNAAQAKALHDRAAINKPNPLAGKIVVIPPERF